MALEWSPAGHRQVTGRSPAGHRPAARPVIGASDDVSDNTQCRFLAIINTIKNNYLLLCSRFV
jgi:hypothetical protein